MKVKITALKAPWPEGSSIGDVVTIDAESLPGWAVGKCVPAEEAAAVSEDQPAADAPAKAARGKK